jgi:hypothetical protein
MSGRASAVHVDRPCGVCLMGRKQTAAMWRRAVCIATPLSHDLSPTHADAQYSPRLRHELRVGHTHRDCVPAVAALSTRPPMTHGTARVC